MPIAPSIESSFLTPLTVDFPPQAVITPRQHLASGLEKHRSREEGYMASIQRTGSSYLLIEDHCPICVAATSCQGLCRSELETFQALLGDSAHIERTEHLLLGARRCAYRITPT